MRRVAGPTMVATIAVALTIPALLFSPAKAANLGPRAALDAASSKPDDFFGPTKVYTLELTIAAADFRRMPPMGRGGRGMAGARALAGIVDDEGGYPKVPATLRVDGSEWGGLTVRYKGNSSYRGAPGVLKRSLKLDFDEPDRTRRFFGLSKVNLNNNAFDPSQMRETLAYDTFRRAGVPAPRTAFAKVYITVPGEYDREYAGVFTIIEQIDQTFFSERWNAKVGVLVKPEGLRGLPDLGADWKRYILPYGSKVAATPADAARLIAFVQFVEHASDEEFAKRIGDYLDVDEFLRFLATEVVIVNTDSPLGMNHNYWVTIHPKTKKVEWLPWDMNMAYGGFRGADANLSLHSPSNPGMFPLADRMLAVPAFLKRYDRIVRDIIDATTPAHVDADMHDIAAAIHDGIAADPTTTLAAFERNLLADFSAPGAADFGGGFGFGGRAAPALRQFIGDRIESVTEQLQGKRTGTSGRGGRGGFLPPPPPRS